MSRLESNLFPDVLKKAFFVYFPGRFKVSRDTRVSASKFSYVRESKFFESFWSQLLDAQFAFRGYVTLDGAWSEEGLANPWGIGSNDLRPVMAQEGKGGVLALGPLFELNCKLDEVLEKARASAGFKSAKDEQYVQIKKNLPYPFDEITEE